MGDWKKKNKECEEIVQDWVGCYCASCSERITKEEKKIICGNKELVDLIVVKHEAVIRCEDCLLKMSHKTLMKKGRSSLSDITEFMEGSYEDEIDDFDF